MIFHLIFLVVVGYSTRFYDTGLDTGINHLMLADQLDLWSLLLRVRVPSQDQRTNDRTNERTNERIDDRINEGTNGKIRLLKKYDKTIQEYLSMP